MSLLGGYGYQSFPQLLSGANNAIGQGADRLNAVMQEYINRKHQDAMQRRQLNAQERESHRLFGQHLATMGITMGAGAAAGGAIGAMSGGLASSPSYTVSPGAVPNGPPPGMPDVTQPTPTFPTSEVGGGPEPITFGGASQGTSVFGRGQIGEIQMAPNDEFIPGGYTPTSDYAKIPQPEPPMDHGMSMSDVGVQTPMESSHMPGISASSNTSALGRTASIVPQASKYAYGDSRFGSIATGALLGMAGPGYLQAAEQVSSGPLRDALTAAHIAHLGAQDAYDAARIGVENKHYDFMNNYYTGKLGRMDTRNDIMGESNAIKQQNADTYDYRAHNPGLGRGGSSNANIPFSAVKAGAVSTEDYARSKGLSMGPGSPAYQDAKTRAQAYIDNDDAASAQELLGQYAGYSNNTQFGGGPGVAARITAEEHRRLINELGL